MKILELTNYSAGIDGVFERVRQESLLLAEKGHEVQIFSSNLIKGKEGIAPKVEFLEKVKITRFQARKMGGESFMYWDFEKEALDFKPDIIMAHSYRHPHTEKALKIARKLKCKAFLVTHAPFDRNSTRSFTGKIAVWLYDKFKGSKISGFDKIIAITKWEIPYLEKLGIKKDNIAYIPNGIADLFFRQKQNKEENKILFLGRVAPIKNLEQVIRIFSEIKDKKIMLEIAGPAENEYLHRLKNMAEKQNRIFFSEAIFNIKDKIKKIDSAKIFILPSKSEGMPQSLIEAMAREKIVLTSNIKASRDIVSASKNGFVFSLEDESSCNDTINKILSMNKKEILKIKRQARERVKEFRWNIIIKKIENLF